MTEEAQTTPCKTPAKRLASTPTTSPLSAGFRSLRTRARLDRAMILDSARGAAGSGLQAVWAAKRKRMEEGEEGDGGDEYDGDGAASSGDASASPVAAPDGKENEPDRRKTYRPASATARKGEPTPKRRPTSAMPTSSVRLMRTERRARPGSAVHGASSHSRKRIAMTKKTNSAASATIERCTWADSSTEMRTFHDERFGVLVDDTRGLFELFTLAGVAMSLGSWEAAWTKRSLLARLFANFEPAAVAELGMGARVKLAKRAAIDITLVEAVVNNARCVLDLETDLLAFCRRSVPDGLVNKRHLVPEDLPAVTAEAEELSAEMRRRGFRFCAPSVITLFLRCSGLVKDHAMRCFLGAES